MPTTIDTVLFDLDGTFADTAQDLAYALNTLLKEQNKDELPFQTIRPVVSHGGIAMIKLGFGIGPKDPGYEDLRKRFLDIYLDNIAVQTRLFDGMAELIEQIEQQQMRWGIVTNKPAWLTDPLMQALGLASRAACIVSGDTTAHSKPHAEPMFHACKVAGSIASQCVYIGDAERDIQAGLNAGMKTLVALFGYIGESDTPDQWGAHGMIKHPRDTWQFIEQWKSSST